MSFKSTSRASKYSLLIHYLIVYPTYYLLAMLVASAFATWYMNWDFEGGKRFFTVIGIVMWLFSYVIHFDVFRASIVELKRKR